MKTARRRRERRRIEGGNEANELEGKESGNVDNEVDEDNNEGGKRGG